MTGFIAAAPGGTSPGHVEAFCSTGSSPGAGLGASHPARSLGCAPSRGVGTLPARLRLDHGGVADVFLRYEDSGPRHGDPLVVLGGISAHGHLAATPEDPTPGWWPGVVGRGHALDPVHHRLVGMEYVAGPSVAVPGEWPVTTADQARAVLAVLDHLGIDRVAVVGASYGGMVALALSLLAPERVARQVLFCAAHRTHPMATAVRALQRRVAALAAGTGRVGEGLALARGLAMTTYRSAGEFETRFPRAWSFGDDGRPRFPVEAYLEARGRAFVERFPAQAFLRLSESIDLHDLDPAPLVVPTTLVSFDSDVLVPSWLVEELKEAVGCPCGHRTLSSPFGHDAFLKEASAVSAVLRQVLAEEVAS